MSDPILLIGAGHMGGALLRGWVARKLTPIIVIEPAPSAELKRVAIKNRVLLLKDTSAVAARRFRACVVALKPQVLKDEAVRLREVARSGTPMISIAAGTMIASLRKAWGPKARIIRAMPNVAGAIGHGVSGLFAAKNVTAADRKLAESLLAAI